MRAGQNPDGIESSAINIKSQDFTTPLTLYDVNGGSSLTSIEGEPFSPAELAAIFALSKAQATMQASISARHSGDVLSRNCIRFHHFSNHLVVQPPTEAPIPVLHQVKKKQIAEMKATVNIHRPHGIEKMIIDRGGLSRVPE